MKHNPEQVVHFRRSPYDVYIARPSIWGNPFVLGVDGTRAEVIQKYYNWIKTQKHLMDLLPTLKGKILGCWCSPKLCHGDALVRILNEIELEEHFS